MQGITKNLLFCRPSTRRRVAIWLVNNGTNEYQIRTEVDNDAAIFEVLGTVALNAAIIEGLLRLHIYDAGRYGMYGAPEKSKTNVEEMKLWEVINQFRKMYQKKPNLAAALKLHSSVRNRVFHAFFYDVGVDLHAFEGRDQIIALLSEIIPLQRREISSITKLQKILVASAGKKSIMKFLEKDDDWERTGVSESNLLKDLRKLQKIKVES